MPIPNVINQNYTLVIQTPGNEPSAQIAAKTSPVAQVIKPVTDLFVTVGGSTGPVGATGARGDQGAPGPPAINLFVQPGVPAMAATTYFWVQTQAGSGNDLSFWVEDGT